MAYSQLKNRFGSFWGLYLTGITSLFSLKWFIGQLFIQLCIQFLVTYYINELAINKTTNDKIIETLIMICIIRTISDIVAYLFDKAVLAERICISKQIGNYVNELYFNASYTWKSKNGHTAQKESIREIFYAYDNMANTLSYTLRSMIQSTVVLIVAFTNDLSIGLSIIVGSCILFKLKKYLDTKLTELDSTMADTMDSAQLLISNQFATRVDIGYTPKYETLFKSDQFDPINGLQKARQVWDNRNNLSNKSDTIINIIQYGCIILISVHLWYIQKAELIMFIVVNNNNLFGFLDVVTNLEQVKNICSSRVATSFKMIDEIISEQTVLTDIIIHPPQTNMMINQIQIRNINRKINDKISLKYDGSIVIDMNKNGIILLDGPKGSGKSVTMDILAGMYDGCVADVYFNTDKLQNEFRDLNMYRTYVRQCIVDDYKLNKKNTVRIDIPN